MKQSRIRSRSRRTVAERRYPDWVFNIREDITRRNMEIYDKQIEQIQARCLEINPDYYSLIWIDKYEVWQQARRDLGLS